MWRGERQRRGEEGGDYDEGGFGRPPPCPGRRQRQPKRGGRWRAGEPAAGTPKSAVGRFSGEKVARAHHWIHAGQSGLADCRVNVRRSVSTAMIL
jgi:hypothetical protein